MYFSARYQRSGQWGVVTVVGELDLATVPQFRTTAHNAIPQADGLVIDLSECGLIDSTGLGVLVGVSRRMREASRPLFMIASSAARLTFERSRLDEIFDIVESLESLGAPELEIGG